jgi:hypothetical protein
MGRAQRSAGGNRQGLTGPPPRQRHPIADRQQHAVDALVVEHSPSMFSLSPLLQHIRVFRVHSIVPNQPGDATK